jgi:chromate reductase
MTEKRRVAVFVGSLRKASLNLMMANALAALSSTALDLQIIPIGDIPLYDEDLDTDQPPASWARFRNDVGAADAVLFITPEYNRSIPGVLKNAIDVGSRPHGRSVWNGKPGAVISVSPGAMGAFGANHHLRQSLVFLNVPAMQQPEAYIGGAGTLFGEHGEITNQGTEVFLRTFMSAFSAWIETTSPKFSRL